MLWYLILLNILLLSIDLAVINTSEIANDLFPLIIALVRFYIITIFTSLLKCISKEVILY